MKGIKFNMEKNSNEVYDKIELNEENPKIAFEVTDLADCHAIYSYLIYIGEKWKRCENCGDTYFKPKTANSNQKYCTTCAKKIKLEQIKKIKQRVKEK